MCHADERRGLLFEVIGQGCAAYTIITSNLGATSELGVRILGEVAHGSGMMSPANPI
jgi:hypothetical protein